MSTLVKYRKAVEAGVRAALPDGPDGVQLVTTHIGEFGPDEVQRYAASAPAVILAPLGMPDIKRAGGMSIITVNYGAFILTKSMTKDDRGDIALAIIEELAKLLPYETWDPGACAQAPKDIDAGNLYTGTVDEMGVSLWVVRWRQAVQIQKTDTSNLADFLRLAVTDYNLDPGEADPNDPAHPQTIELPGPE
jgi:hypothetical protein